MAGAKKARPFSPAEAGGAEESWARDSSLRFSGEGRAQAQGSRGPRSSAMGDGQGLLPDSPPSPSWLWPRTSLPPSHLRGESEAPCIAKFQ